MDKDATATSKDRFDAIDTQLQAMNSTMNMQFDKIAAVVVKGFDRINKALEAKADKTDVQRILGQLDAFIKKQDISDDERLVMGHQLERLDRWTHELAEKIGYKLTI
jgi:uncharacterized protein YicC (UPF0701 family)